MLQIVVQTLFADVDGLLELVLSLFKSGCIEEHGTVVPAVEHEVLELLPRLFAVPQPALAKSSFQEHSPDLVDLPFACFLDGVN